MYAPPEDDNLEFFLNQEALDNMEGDLGLICGDFKTTLNIKDNRFGYTTDSHKKCTHTINSLIKSNELVDVGS